MTDFININILVLDSNNKKFKGFPFKGKFSNETAQKQKICDENGICKLSLKVGTTYQISVLKPDDSYQEKLVINATADLDNSTQKIVLENPINAYLASIILTAKDISTPPQVVPKAQLQITYMGKTSIRDMDNSGVLKLKTLIGEPLQFQLIDPLSKQPMQGTHIDEITAKKMTNAVTVVQPSIRADASLEPDRPDTTTPKTPESDMTITMAQMKKMFESATSTKMQPILDELNNNLKEYKLDTKLRQAHFMAQVRQEVGATFKLREQVEYMSPTALKKIGYYRKNPKQADIDGWKGKGHGPANGEIIANRMYEDRYRPTSPLGNTSPGDGWKYLGRGLKQLTGKYNYNDLTIMYSQVWKDEKQDFVKNPELLEQPKYAVRSAIRFWLKFKLYDIADKGATNTQVDAITKIINKSTDSYVDRQKNFVRAKVIFN